MTTVIMLIIVIIIITVYCTLGPFERLRDNIVSEQDTNFENNQKQKTLISQMDG